MLEIAVMHIFGAGYFIISDILYLILSSLFFFKTSSKKSRMFLAGYALLSFIAFMVNIYIYDIVDEIMFLGILLLSLLFDRDNVSSNLIYSLFSFSIVDLSVLIVSTIMTDIPDSCDTHPMFLMLFIWAIEILSSCIIYKIVVRCIKRYESILDDRISLIIALYAYISVACIDFVSHRINLFGRIIPLIITFLIIQSIFIVILFNFELSRHDELNRQKMQQSEINSLMEYTEKLEKEERRLRKFKHDSQNMLLSLKELADFEDRNEFKQGVMNLEEYFNVRFASNEIWGFNDFDNLKNPYVKSIFISKVQDMRNMKITAEFSCPKIIEDIDIPVFDLVRVLGITLDNAVEAVSGNRNGRIAMNIMKVRGAVKFVISNTVTGSHKPVGQLIQEGYTTKSRHHGLGLGNIKDIRKENGNLFVSYKYEEDMFVATITVQQKEG